jgi:hypothetical protein
VVFVVVPPFPTRMTRGESHISSNPGRFCTDIGRPRLGPNDSGRTLHSAHFLAFSRMTTPCWSMPCPLANLAHTV